jgi:hypothetical protein
MEVIMRGISMRILGAAVALILVLALALPALAAAPGEGVRETGRVLVAIGGDLTLPAGEQADVVIVLGGTARVEGSANVVLVADGAAILRGARVETLVIAGGTATLGAGTEILGDVRTLEATVDRQAGATVAGAVRGLETDFLGIGMVLGPALFLVFVGFGLATIVAALAVAALAGRQLWAAQTLIRERPLATLFTGLGGVVLTPIVAFIAIVTIVGLPLGVSLLLVVWPAVAFIGYLVAATWIGTVVLERTRGTYDAERPYAAALVGVVVLWILSFIPPVTAIISLIGFGAVLLLAWEVLRGGGARASGRVQWPGPMPA